MRDRREVAVHEMEDGGRIVQASCADKPDGAVRSFTTGVFCGAAVAMIVKGSATDSDEVLLLNKLDAARKTAFTFNVLCACGGVGSANKTEALGPKYLTHVKQCDKERRQRPRPPQLPQLLRPEGGMDTLRDERGFLRGLQEAHAG